jgi:hypothetical protein
VHIHVPMANQLAVNRRVFLPSEPEIDQKNDEKRGQNQPRDQDYLDPHAASRRDVVVHIRIPIKESPAITKMYAPPIKLIRRKNVPAIRRAGRATGLIRASILYIDAIIFRSEAIQVCLSRAEPGPFGRRRVCATIGSGPSFPDKCQAVFPR